jgi:hypothetical protein
MAPRPALARRPRQYIRGALGAYFPRDPGNDFAANATALGAGLAYETPS